MPHKIILKTDFTAEPYGRYKKIDGEFCGEIFREKLLAPALKEHKKVIVDLDDTMGLLPSFLDEAFGGLVRKEGFTKEELNLSLTIISDEDPTHLDRCWDSINNATPQ